MKYAKTTTVSVEQTKAEIEVLLKRYKATNYAAGYQGQLAFVMFSFADRAIRFNLFVPNAKDKRFNQGRTNPQRQAEQFERSMWRSLLLVIKAKLECVETGIETIEEAFLAQTLVRTTEGGTATMAEVLKSHPEALGSSNFVGAIGWKEPTKV